MAQMQKEFDEKVIEINRVSQKTKGGNKMSFTALVAVGDKKGKVGIGLGKAKDVLSAIQKGVRRAKRRMIIVPLKDSTLPHAIRFKHGASFILLKPAPEGTGVIAGGAVRSVLELAGVRNVVSKIMGSSGKLGNVTATFEALKAMDRIVKIKRSMLGSDHPALQGAKKKVKIAEKVVTEVVKETVPAKKEVKKAAPKKAVKSEAKKVAKVAAKKNSASKAKAKKAGSK